MPSITIYCEGGHYFSSATLHEFLKTKKCTYCGKPPKPKKGVVCRDCRGYIEHARSSYSRCVTCHNKPETEEEEYDMLIPRKPIRQHWFVKAAPEDDGSESTKVAGGALTAYYNRSQADTVAESLATRDARTFVVYESVTSFRAARAEQSPIVAEEEDCAKKPWHKDGTFCDNPQCACCPTDCEDTTCRDCKKCRDFKSNHPRAYEVRHAAAAAAITNKTLCGNANCSYCYSLRKS